jgi:hypothetical protein
MLMRLSERMRGKGLEGADLKGRTGHRVARLNDWLFVMGGVGRQGLWNNEVQRVNCQTGSIDTLITDTTLCLEDFSLFVLQDNLYLWGGTTMTSPNDPRPRCTQQLLHFDYSRFTPL